MNPLSDLDYRELFCDAVHMLAEVAKAAGFDPTDENVEPPAIVARVANTRARLAEVEKERAAALAEVARLKRSLVEPTENVGDPDSEQGEGVAP